MQNCFKFLGTAALLSFSLLGLTPKAKAEMATFTKGRIIFSCIQNQQGDWVTMPQMVRETRYSRYSNVVVDREVVLESDEPMILWTNTLGDGYTSSSRCYTVSNRLTNLANSLGFSKLEEIGRAATIHGVVNNEYIKEKVIFLSDKDIRYPINFSKKLSVGERAITGRDAVVLTLSPENARRFARVLEQFKAGVSLSIGGEEADIELPIEE